MWLSDSGQTTTILAPTNSATRIQVSGARLTVRLRSERQAAARTNAATHQTSTGRNSRTIAVSVRTGSAMPSSSWRGRRSRIHTVDELACQTGSRRQRVACVLDAPRLDPDHFDRPSMPTLAFDDLARQPRELGVSRQHGGAAGRIAERRRDGDLLGSSDGAHEYTDVPPLTAVGGGEHPEAAALPRGQPGGRREGHLAAGDDDQQRHW